MPVTKVLIANRGEIACRVIRTCREMRGPLRDPRSGSGSAAIGDRYLHKVWNTLYAQAN